MTELKCPFCQQKLAYDDWNELYMCRNPNCKHLLGFGTKELWQALDRTRNALGLALDWLREVATPAKCDDDLCREFTKRKLAEIKTALEQKDIK